MQQLGFLLLLQEMGVERGTQNDKRRINRCDCGSNINQMPIGNRSAHRNDNLKMRGAN